MTMDAGAPTGASASEPNDDEVPVIVRRVPRAAGKLVPRPTPPPKDDHVVARGLLQPRAATKKVVRQRAIAGDLPAWSPLPPGELTVRRPGA